ncbi:MAG TPA: 2-polyprenylphenol 6-hydroxylase, partial [Stellaceae bacterium]
MLAVLRAGRNLVRLVEIAFILARYDALFPLEGVVGARFIIRALRIVRRGGGVRAGLRPGQRLALALQAMGPSFIKLGQALSTRADLIGEAVATDLSSLQDRLPPFPASEARRTIEIELSRPVELLYRDFD